MANLETEASWGVDETGHEVAFIPGPHDSSAFASGEQALNTAMVLEAGSKHIIGEAATDMMRRANELVRLAADQELRTREFPIVELKEGH